MITSALFYLSFIMFLSSVYFTIRREEEVTKIFLLIAIYDALIAISIRLGIV